MLDDLCSEPTGKEHIMEQEKAYTRNLAGNDGPASMVNSLELVGAADRPDQSCAVVGLWFFGAQKQREQEEENQLSQDTALRSCPDHMP